MTVVCQVPLFMGFLRQEYWRELPFPPPVDFPNSGIEFTSPSWQADSLPLSHQGSPYFYIVFLKIKVEKAMAPHSSTLASKIPCTEEPGRLQSMGLLRVGHDWATSLSLSLSCTGEGNGNPLQYSCLEYPRDGGALWAAVYGVAQSQTQLKRLSSSSKDKSSYIETKWN